MLLLGTDQVRRAHHTLILVTGQVAFSLQRRPCGCRWKGPIEYDHFLALAEGSYPFVVLGEQDDSARDYKPPLAVGETRLGAKETRPVNISIARWFAEGRSVTEILHASREVGNATLTRNMLHASVMAC